MENQINIENYEAFYLDYLEGNLDEDATLSLFAFLAEHPDLQVEDLGPELTDTVLTLDVDFKNNLKQDPNSLPISNKTIEYFLTAEKENQLSASKLSELNVFIAENPSFQLDRKIYSLATLNADKSIVYSDKNSLKRRETILMWPFLSALVAACAVLVLWLLPNPNFNGEIQSAAGVPTFGVKVKKSNLPNSNARSVINEDYDPSSAARFVAQSDNKTEKGLDGKQIEKKDISIRLSTRKINSVNAYTLENVDFNSNLTEKQPTAIAYQPIEVNETPITTLAMTNPVKPLTNKLSDIIKTQVDYKTGENAESQRKGFYLKIGQFEISQNKKVKNQD
jgi:hypothetical protein